MTTQFKKRLDNVENRLQILEEYNYYFLQNNYYQAPMNYFPVTYYPTNYYQPCYQEVIESKHQNTNNLKSFSLLIRSSTFP